MLAAEEISELSIFFHDEDIGIAQYPTEHDILQSVTKCIADSIVKDENDNEEDIKNLHKKLTAFDDKGDNGSKKMLQIICFNLNKSGKISMKNVFFIINLYIIGLQAYISLGYVLKL